MTKDNTCMGNDGFCSPAEKFVQAWRQDLFGNGGAISMVAALNTLLNEQYDEGYFDGSRDKAIEIEQAAHDLIPKKKAVRFKPPIPEEIEAYAKSIGLKIDGKTFISYYADNNWCNSQGKKVRNWKTTLKNNWDRPENRIAPQENYLIPRTH